MEGTKNPSSVGPSIFVKGRVLQGTELKEYAQRHGLCTICGQFQTHKRVRKGMFGTSWEPITVQNDDGEFTAYKGYCIQPTCYQSVEHVKELLGEVPSKQMLRVAPHDMTRRPPSAASARSASAPLARHRARAASSSFSPTRPPASAPSYMPPPSFQNPPPLHQSDPSSSSSYDKFKFGTKGSSNTSYRTATTAPVSETSSIYTSGMTSGYGGSRYEGGGASTAYASYGAPSTSASMSSSAAGGQGHLRYPYPSLISSPSTPLNEIFVKETASSDEDGDNEEDDNDNVREEHQYMDDDSDVAEDTKPGKFRSMIPRSAVPSSLVEESTPTKAKAKKKKRLKKSKSPPVRTAGVVTDPELLFLDVDATTTTSTTATSKTIAYLPGSSSIKSLQLLIEDGDYMAFFYSLEKQETSSKLLVVEALKLFRKKFVQHQTDEPNDILLSGDHWITTMTSHIEYFPQSRDVVSSVYLTFLTISSLSVPHYRRSIIESTTFFEVLFKILDAYRFKMDEEVCSITCSVICSLCDANNHYGDGSLKSNKYAETAGVVVERMVGILRNDYVRLTDNDEKPTYSLGQDYALLALYYLSNQQADAVGENSLASEKVHTALQDETIIKGIIAMTVDGGETKISSGPTPNVISFAAMYFLWKISIPMEEDTESEVSNVDMDSARNDVALSTTSQELMEAFSRVMKQQLRQQRQRQQRHLQQQQENFEDALVVATQTALCKILANLALSKHFENKQKVNKEKTSLTERVISTIANPLWMEAAGDDMQFATSRLHALCNLLMEKNSWSRTVLLQEPLGIVSLITTTFNQCGLNGPELTEFGFLTICHAAKNNMQVKELMISQDGLLWAKRALYVHSNTIKKGRVATRTTTAKTTMMTATTKSTEKEIPMSKVKEAVLYSIVCAVCTLTSCRAGAEQLSSDGDGEREFRQALLRLETNDKFKPMIQTIRNNISEKSFDETVLSKTPIVSLSTLQDATSEDEIVAKVVNLRLSDWPAASIALSNDGFATLLRVMSDNEHSLSVQEECCALLAVIYYHLTPSNSSRGTSSQDDFDVGNATESKGKTTLEEPTQLADGSSIVIHSRQSIEYIRRVMKTFRGRSPSVQYSGALALCNCFAPLCDGGGLTFSSSSNLGPLFETAESCLETVHDILNSDTTYPADNVVALRSIGMELFTMLCMICIPPDDKSTMNAVATVSLTTSHSFSTIIPLIVDAMNKHADVMELVDTACYALYVARNDHESLKYITSAEGIGGMMNILKERQQQQNRKQEEQQSETNNAVSVISLLASLVDKIELASRHIAQFSDGIKVLAQTMAMNTNNPGLVEGICSIFGSIAMTSIDDTTKIAIAKQDVFLSLCDVLQQESTFARPILIQKACRVLTLVAPFVSDDTMMVGRANMSKALFSCLTKAMSPPTNTEIEGTIPKSGLVSADSANVEGAVSEVLQAMSSCSVKDEYFKSDLMTSRKNISAVVEAMTSFLGNEKVQLGGCTFLRILSDNDRGKELIGHCDGIPTVLNAILAHNLSAPIQQEGLRVLKNLATLPSNKPTVASLDGTNAVQYSLRIHHDRPEVQSVGLAAMNNMSVDPKTKTVDPMPAGTLEVVMFALRRFPADETLQKNACYYLRSCAYLQENVTLISSYSDQIIPLLQSASKRFPDACSKSTRSVLNKLQRKQMNPFGSANPKGLDESERRSRSFSALTIESNEPSMRQITIPPESLLPILKNFPAQKPDDEDEEYLKRILFSCQEFVSNQDVAKAGCEMVDRLSREDGRRQELGETVAWRFLTRSLFRYSDMNASEALSKLTAKDDLDAVNASLRNSMVGATPSDIAVIFRVMVMKVGESENITESCFWLLSLAYEDDISSPVNSAYNLIVSNLESIRMAMRQHGKNRKRIPLYGFRILRSLLVGLQTHRYDLKEIERQSLANGCLADVVDVTRDTVIDAAGVDAALDTFSVAAQLCDEHLKPIATTSVLRNLYIMVKTRQSDAAIIGAACRQILTWENRTDEFSRVQLFEAIKVAVMTPIDGEAAHTDQAAQMVIQSLHAIVDALHEETESTYLCLHVLSWFKSLVKRCASFASHSSIQELFCVVVTSVAKSTKFEFMPNIDVRATVQYICSSLGTVGKNNKLLCNICGAFVAMSDAGQVERDESLAMTKLLYEPFRRFVSDVGATILVMRALAACQKQQHETITTEYIELILKAMKQHSSSLQIQRIGCVISKSLSVSQTGTALVGLIAGIVEAVLTYGKDECIQEDGFDCLTKIVQHPLYDSSSGIDITTAVKMLKQIASNPKLFGKGLVFLNTIWNKWQVSDAQNSQRVDLAAEVVKAMGKFPLHGDIQTQGSIWLDRFMESKPDDLQYQMEDLLSGMLQPGTSSTSGLSLLAAAETLLASSKISEELQNQLKDRIIGVLTAAAKRFPDQCSASASLVISKLDKSAPSHRGRLGAFGSAGSGGPSQGGDSSKESQTWKKKSGDGDDDGSSSDDDEEEDDDPNENRDGSAQPDSGGGPDRPPCLHVFQAAPLAWRGEYGWLPMPQLDFGWERKQLKDALTGTRLSALYDIATSDRFNSFLTNSKGNVLHFSGHGCEYSWLGHRNFLVLESDGWGGMHPLVPKELQALAAMGIVSNKDNPIKLVFIAACHSRSVGEALVASGIPNVVCCERDEYTLSNTIATHFQKAFYRALARGVSVRGAFETAKKETQFSSIQTKEALDAEVAKYCLLPVNSNHDDRPFQTTHGTTNVGARTLTASAAQFASAGDDVGGGDAVLTFPDPPSPFLARQLERFRIIQYLKDTHLVRVAGAPGIGKRAVVASVCQYVTARRDIIGIDEILWCGSSSSTSSFTYIRDKQFRDQFSILFDPEHPKEGREQAIDDVICKLHGKKWLIVIEREWSVLLGEFLECLFRNNQTVRVILIERSVQGKDSTDDGYEGENSSAGNDNKVLLSCIEQRVIIDWLDVESSLLLFGCMCIHIENPRAFRDHMIKIFSEKPLVRKDIVDSIGNGNPEQILKLAKKCTKQEMERLFNLQNFEWNFDSRVALDNTRQKLRNDKEAAINNGDYHRAKFIQQKLDQVDRLEYLFPDMPTLERNYERTRQELKAAASGGDWTKLERLIVESEQLGAKLVSEYNAFVKCGHNNSPDNQQHRPNEAILSSLSGLDEQLRDALRTNNLKDAKKANARLELIHNATMRAESQRNLEETVCDMRERLDEAETQNDVQSKSEIRGWFHRAKKAIDGNMKTGVFFTTTVLLCSAAAVAVTKSKRG